LATFVAFTWVVSAALSATVMPWSGNWIAAALAGLLVLGMAAYAVPSFGGVQARWAASGFFHLAFSFTVGPPAVLTMAIAESVGVLPRRRPGPFRTAANISNHFLADTSAWAAFRLVAGAHPIALVAGAHPIAVTLALAGVAGAFSEGIVNRLVLMTALRLAHEPASIRGWLLNLAQSLPMVVPFGITAAGATFLYGAEGTWGIVTLLLPLAIVQASMVALARRAHAQAQAQEREAEALRREARASRVAASALRRAGDASEVERKKIAADLHDSVIQDVSGLFIRSSALLGRLSDGDAEGWSRERVEAFLNYTRDLAGEAVQELRTLMIELAPPLLDEEGLASALRQLLTRLDREQISWVLECAEEPLDQRHQRLVYRVVQEALRNIIKHAQCHSVWVTVRPQGGRLVASIRDDGRGFSAAERADRRKKGHAGLGLLGQTVRDGGGELTITSVRGKGTTLRLVIPMLPSPTLEDGGGDGSGVSGHAHVDEEDPDGQAAEPRSSVTGRSRVRKPPEPIRETSAPAP
jgi:signal transduction histidine kinase